MEGEGEGGWFAGRESLSEMGVGVVTGLGEGCSLVLVALVGQFLRSLGKDWS